MGLWPASDTKCGRDGERFPQWDAREKKFVSDADNAIVTDTHQPRRPFTFDTTFSLNQPGAQIATIVYLVHNTDNGARSETMMVQRPF